jgi:hypothetical protein
MGGHGIYVARTDIPKWTRTVNQLMTDTKAWKAASADVRKRAAKITYQRDQLTFVRHVETLAQ